MLAYLNITQDVINPFVAQMRTRIRYQYQFHWKTGKSRITNSASIYILKNILPTWLSRLHIKLVKLRSLPIRSFYVWRHLPCVERETNDCGLYYFVLLKNLLFLYC